MKIDKSNMRGVILNSPNQFEEALESARDIKVEGKFENIVICGLGGSALPANILACWLNGALPIYIHRDYNLPPQAGKKSLVICISYSGNTEETVSALNLAVKKRLKIAAITTNGKIEKICKKYKIPLAKIPSGIQPRSATGYLFSSLAKILMNSGIVKETKEISETAQKLRSLDCEKEGKDLARKLSGKIPIIYASNKMKCLARIWKIKFNENSKNPAFYNYFPELNHNEMVGFSRPEKNSEFHIIILRDKEDHPRNLKRMKLFSNLMKEKGIGAEFIDIKKGTCLFKIFSSLLLGDWVTYYLALENKVDPTPVKIVEKFKKKLILKKRAAGMAKQQTR